MHLEAVVASELLVARDRDVADRGVRDVGADVEGRGAGRPVARALLPADRPPREDRAAQPQRLRTGAREIERRVAPAQHVARGMRRGVGERLQHEALGVPERVPVVARARQPLRRDRAQLGAPACLDQLEEREAHGLLQRRVALDLDVRGRPEVVEVLALGAADLVPAGHLRLGERGSRLRAQRGERADARPRVGEQLDDPQLLAGLQLDRRRHAPDVVGRVDLHVDPVGPVEDVIHGGHHAQTALPRRVREQHGHVHRFRGTRAAAAGRASQPTADRGRDRAPSRSRRAPTARPRASPRRAARPRTAPRRSRAARTTRDAST